MCAVRYHLFVYGYATCGNIRHAVNKMDKLAAACKV